MTEKDVEQNFINYVNETIVNNEGYVRELWTLQGHEIRSY